MRLSEYFNSDFYRAELEEQRKREEIAQREREASAAAIQHAWEEQEKAVRVREKAKRIARKEAKQAALGYADWSPFVEARR